MKTRSSNRQQKRKLKLDFRQIVVRFPEDVAEEIKKDLKNIQFKLIFRDNHHAEVLLNEKKYEGILYELPTIAETFRTNDGFHLFKSGDITKILIVYRKEDVPKITTDDYIYESGITSPTQNIVLRRKAKHEAYAQKNEDSYFSEVDYWDLAELQISAIRSKEDDCSKHQKFEIFEEPDIDPRVLEIILRKNGHPEFEGYSGCKITQNDIDGFDVERELKLINEAFQNGVDYTCDFKFELQNYNESDSDFNFTTTTEDELPHDDSKNNNQEIEETNNEKFVEDNDNLKKNEDLPEHISDQNENSKELTSDQPILSEDIQQSYSLLEDFEEEEESQDAVELRNLQKRKEALLAQLEMHKNRLANFETSADSLIEEKIKNKILTINQNILDIDSKIKSLQSSQ